MAEDTAIEWCDHTFNPWVGCTEVSPACDHCYARTWAGRAGRPTLWQGERALTSAVNWRGPVNWNRKAEIEGVRYRVFCASLADVFDASVDQSWRQRLWDLIKATPHLDWLLLTKRIGNAKRMLPAPYWVSDWPNVWIGATVVNQAEADRDIPKLLALKAARRFLSIEPMLGEISLLDPFGMKWDATINCFTSTRARINGRAVDGVSGIDWVICGGESGGKARPLEESWADNLRIECQAAGAAFFMKQGSAANWPEYKNFDAFPAQLKVRQWPSSYRRQELR